MKRCEEGNRFLSLKDYKRIEEEDESKKFSFGVPASIWSHLILPKLDLRDLFMLSSANRALYTLVSKYTTEICLPEVSNFINFESEEFSTFLIFLSKKFHNCKKVKSQIYKKKIPFF